MGISTALGAFLFRHSHFYTLHSRSRYCFSAYTTLPYPIHYWIA